MQKFIENVGIEHPYSNNYFLKKPIRIYPQTYLEVEKIDIALSQITEQDYNFCC
jgi:hypothetical protein